MAHIINKIGVMSRVQARAKQLSCMEDIKECALISDPKKSIDESIERAAMIKKMLEVDVFERENRLKQSAEAKKNIK